MLVCCEICGCVFSDRDHACPLCKHSVDFSRRVGTFGGGRVVPQVLFALCVFLTASAITLGLVQYSRKYARPTGPVVFDLDGIQQARINTASTMPAGLELHAEPEASPEAEPNAGDSTPASSSSLQPGDTPKTIPEAVPQSDQDVQTTLEAQQSSSLRPDRANPRATEAANGPGGAPQQTAAAPGARIDEPIARPTPQKPPQTQVRTSTASKVTPANGLPDYELLLAAHEYRSESVYAEVLVPSLSPGSSLSERRAIMRAIASQEGFESGTLYCTRQAHEAHYSMDFADRHPKALSNGLLGTYSRGRFTPHRD